MTEYIEKLKRNSCNCEGDNGHCTECNYDWGYNAAIDELHSRGLIVQEGFVSVPIEPTSVMCEAGIEQFLTINNGDEYGAEQIYKAMIAATQKKED